MSDHYLSIQEIAKQTRQSLKAEFPQCKFSVTIQQFSGGRSMTVALMAAPFEPFIGDKTADGYPFETDYEQLNPFQLARWPDDNDQYCNGIPLTEQAWKLLSRVTRIAQRQNWDRSDIMTDHFDVGYYLDVHIGKYDKPFQVQP